MTKGKAEVMIRPTWAVDTSKESMKKPTTLASFFFLWGCWKKGPETSKIMKKVKERKSKFNRKYDDSYMKFGFMASGDAAAPNPLWVVCGEKLAN